MIILPQNIEITWTNKTKKYYELKGYTFTKNGDVFNVNVLDLQPNSHKKIKCKCDYCGKEILKEYRKYYKDNDICCNKCQNKKTQKILLEKYNVTNISQLQETKEKVKQTCLERYNVENVSQNKEIKKKKENTCMKHFGCKNSSQSDIIKEKTKQTNLKKYGATCHMKSDEFKAKFEKNNELKHGYKYPFQSKDIQKKIHINATKTMYKNGTAPCSKPQKYLCDLLNGKLNYAYEQFWLDIAFPNEMIYIEYDGGGHDYRVKCGWQTKKDFQMQEMKRQYFLKNKGWKLIRIKSENDLIPQDDDIIKLINKAKQYLINYNHTWIKIDIDNGFIECSMYNKKIYLNNLIYVK